jgi:gamma-glutamylcyclotransferase (GGCT)/AIG2-like uncharacterized protein YtfP
MGNLFAYGTLMCEDIMEEVSGCCLTGMAGTVRGYSRRSVKGERYPALAPDEKGCVEGVAYRDLPVSAWDRLDRFEGRMYVRTLVEIELSDGTILPAETYVVRQEFKDQLEESEWNFEDFQRNGKESFQRNYKGYRQL